MTLRLSFVLTLIAAPQCFGEPPTVRAKLEKAQAWTGEPVPLIVVLYSPGPFSGTASFDLPQLPQTVIVNSGNPVVGNEEVDDVSYFTQRHEFTLYTQRSGEVVVPRFRTRYSGKKTFTSDPVPMEGFSAELRFQSKRPPGTESLGVVVSATRMETRQTWNPAETEQLRAGDILQRTVVRKAEGTTAMMLPRVPTESMSGVRVHSLSPTVQDHTERGEAQAQRTDRLEYQFQRPGSYVLPELVVVWWEPEAEKLQRQTLAGKTVNVVSARKRVNTVEGTQEPTRPSWGGALVALLGFVLLGLLAYKPTTWLLAKWRTDRNLPEQLAIRKLRAACASNDAPLAYSALMTWFATVQRNEGCDSVDTFLAREENLALRDPWYSLSKQMFGSKSNTTPWEGEFLWRAFHASRTRRARRDMQHPPSSLPPLNPTER